MSGQWSNSWQRDVEWLQEIGFRSCMNGRNQNDQRFPIEPSEGHILLKWDIDRLNLLEDNYIERTGKQPPPIVGAMFRAK